MSSSPNTDFPYHRVADDLRDAVLTGRLVPGERLRSEWEMAELYATSRPTVRRAVALLKAEGLLVTAQGRGTYVRPTPPVRLTVTASRYREHRARRETGFNAQVTDQGRRPKQEVLDVVESPAPESVAERLGVAPGTALIVRRRRFLIDDHPVALCESRFLAELVRGTSIAERRLITGGATAAVEAICGPVRRTVDDLTARMPTQVERDELQLGTGVPVVLVSRVLYDGAGRAIELQDTVAAADRHQFRYEVEL